MKHVLVLNQFALPRSQGGGTRHIDLFSRLDGWETSIVAGNRNHYSQKEFETSDPRFHLVRVPSQDGGAKARLTSWLVYCARAARIGITQHELDVVYASSPHLLAPLVGWGIARTRRASFVLEIRDLWPESFVAAGLLRRDSPVHRVLKTLESFVVSRADKVVVVTDGWGPHFAALGVSAERLTVVPNGTEASDFDLPAGFDRVQARRCLGISGVTGIFAGAHGPKDGIDLILDAAREVPEVNFLLIGDGPSKAAAIARAKNDGLDNVEFRDPVAKSDLVEVLAACDIGVHAVTPLPVFELGMSPNKLFDYLASGLPVVSNAGNPVRALIGADRCGHVGDAHSLAEGVRRVNLADDTTRFEWKQAAADLLSREFSRTAAANRLASVLNRTAGEYDVAEQPRIVHLTTAHPARDNRIFRKECQALASAGFDVTLVAVADEAETVDGVRISPLPRRNGRAARMLRGPLDAMSALRRLNPDVVHGHDPELIPALAAWKLTHPRVTVLFDAHEDLPKQIAGKPYIPRPLRRVVALGARGIELLADRALDGVVVATPAIRRNFRAERTTLVQNFPWLSDFPAPQKLSPDAPRQLCYVGALSEARGLSTMIDAVNHAEPSAQLLIAGKATRDAAATMAAAGDRVTYVGERPALEMPALIAESAIGLALLEPLPNYLESQATKIFEYMAAARPFIASNFPAWRAMFGEIDCGIFVDPHDRDAVRQAVNSLLNDPVRAAEMGLRGRAALEDRFTFEVEAAELISFVRTRRQSASTF